MIVMIDNYDSFTYNLYQMFLILGEDIKVFRNDEIKINEIKNLNPKKIVLSPGPGRPENAGIMMDVIDAFYKDLPMLGICLGHQGICHYFGGEIVHAKNIMHGKTSKIHHTGKGIFEGIKKDFDAMRYHSLVLKKESLPKDLEITAISDDGEIMGIRHKNYKITGLQYHPESICTEEGLKQLQNFSREE